jgi:hypothetical protein
MRTRSAITGKAVKSAGRQTDVLNNKNSTADHKVRKNPDLSLGNRANPFAVKKPEKGFFESLNPHEKTECFAVP